MTRIRLALLLLLCLLLAMPWAGAKGAVLLPAAEGQGPPSLLAPQGKSLYLLRPDGLYRWDSSLEEPELLHGMKGNEELTQAAALVAGQEGQLFVLGSAWGPLWAWDEAGQRFEKRYDRGSAGDEDPFLYRHFFAFEGKLYAIGTNLMDSAQTQLVAIEPTGPRLVKAGIALATPYRPGQLLVMQDARMTGGGLKLAALDMKSNAVHELLPLTGDFRGLAYDEEADTVYLVRQGELLSSKGFQEPVPALRLPLDFSLWEGTILPGPGFAYADADGVHVLTPDNQAKAGLSLNILGYTWELPMASFSQDHPDIALSFNPEYPDSTPALAMHMASGEGAADIYVINSAQYELDKLFAKGWYYDLGQDAAIAAGLGRMYPYLRQALTREGNIFALPFTAEYAALCIFSKPWQQMGLTEQDIPRDYPALLDFVARWHRELTDKYPDISLFGAGAEARVYKMVLLNHLLTQWRLACQAQNQPLRYEPLRGLLQQLLDADFSRIGASTMGVDHGEPGLRLLHPGVTLHLGTMAEPAQYRPMSVLPDMPAYTAGRVNLLLINPHTQNAQAALRFVRYVLDHLPPHIKPLLMPEANEPVAITQDLGHFLITIQALKKQAADSEGAQRREYEAQLAFIEDEYQQMSQSWLVSAEGLISLRSMDKGFLLEQASDYPGTGTGAENNISRLLDGQMSLDQYIREADQTEKLREAEAGAL